MASSRPKRYETADGFEYDVEPDFGVNLTTGERWCGWRVKYRIEGARRWVRFIIVDATSETDALAAIKAHYQMRGGQIA